MQTIGDFTNMSESLALMPDPALQQFAQMHRDDPFTLALAVSESNRRKKQRIAQQGLAGMQQQPPVADQEIAQMNEPAMPENVGIGALPAPVLAGMPAGGIAGEEEVVSKAGGGLVAFADGGNVERYQFGGMPPASGGTEFAIPGMVQPSRSFMPQAGAPEQEPFLRRMFRDAELQSARRRAAEAQARIDRGLNYESDREAILALQSLERQAAAPNPATTVGVQGAAAENLSGMDRRLMANPQSYAASAPGAASSTANKSQPAQAGTPPATGAKPPPAAGAGIDAGAGRTPAVMPGGIGDINAMFTRALSAQKYEDPAKEDVAKLGRTMKEGAEGRLSEFDKYIQKTGDVFKGREERLGKRESELEKQKDTNTGLAFLNAGLAIMSTPGGLATAIGKGARVGTEQFASGLEKIRAAKDRLDDARDRVEELKLNRADMTFKDRQALQSDINKAEADALKLGIEGTRLAAGVTEKRAAEVVGNQVRVGIAQFQEAGATARAAMQERGATARANAPSAQERLALTLGGGNLEKGLTRIAEINAGKFDPKKAYTEYLVAAQKTPGTDLMSYAQFIGQFAIPTSPGNNPAAAPGTVRER
jgi:hypothetical protein